MSMAENRFRHIGFLYQPLPAAAYIFIDDVNLTYGKMLLVFIFGLVGLVMELWWQDRVACCGLAASEIDELVD